MKKNFLKRNNGITTGMLIVILVIAIIVVGTLAYLFIFKKGSGLSIFVQDDKEQNLNAPKISLEANEDSKEVIEVKIKILATTDDEAGVKGIRLPNGSVINGEEYEYKVTENGTYTFYAIGNNGSETSAEIEISNIIKASASTPYIPEGFEHVEGEPDTGYVIKDKYDNEFVWVPVPSGIPTRNTNFDGDYEDSTDTSTELVNSIASYYGFYVARYEASKSAGNRVAVIPDADPWTNITYKKAEEYSKKMVEDYRYEDDIKTSIINSYAWDTTLEWINKSVENYSTKLDYGNYSGEVAKTGETSSDKVNNVCDLSGNVREWTSEVYKNVPKTTPSNSTNSQNTETVTSYRVIRGGSANISSTAARHQGYSELQEDAYWGFRVILYKAVGSSNNKPKPTPTPTPTETPEDNTETNTSTNTATNTTIDVNNDTNQNTSNGGILSNILNGLNNVNE